MTSHDCSDLEPQSFRWQYQPRGRGELGRPPPTAIDTLNFNSGAIITTLTGTATALDADFSGVISPWTLAGAQLILGGLLTVNAGATLSGNGTVAGTIADNGTIKASGGLLTLSGSVGGTGLLQLMSVRRST